MFPPNVEPQLEHGTVGWEDEEDYHFLGTSDNDGYTLVRVQLYRGRDLSQPLKSDIAQGHKIVCHINGMLGYRVPPKGTRVLVAFPKGMEHVDGGGVIVATYEKNPAEQFASSRAKLDFGADVDLVIKARSVVISDYADNYVAVGPDFGCRLADSDGNLFQVLNGITGIASSSITLVTGTSGGTASSGLYLNGTTAAMTGGATMVKLNGGTGMGTWISAQVSLAAGSIGLGVGASPATPVQIAPFIPSTTVFASP